MKKKKKKKMREHSSKANFHMTQKYQIGPFFKFQRNRLQNLTFINGNQHLERKITI